MKKSFRKEFKIMIAFLLVLAIMPITACTKKVTDTSKKTPATTSETNEIDQIKSAGILKVGCKVDVPKFGLLDTATGEYSGFEIDLAYHIAGKIFGVTPEEAKAKKLVKFQGVTAKTRGALLDNGEIDLVLATFTITEERKKSWNFSTPYFTDAIGLMCLADAPYKSIKDLDGAIIGVAQGSSTQAGIEQYIKDKKLSISPTFQEFDGYPALSAALTSGNIDIFSVDRAILAGYKDNTTKILPDRFAEQEYGVASAMKNTNLAALVDEVITDLIDSKMIDTIIKNWEIE